MILSWHRLLCNRDIHLELSWSCMLNQQIYTCLFWPDDRLGSLEILYIHTAFPNKWWSSETDITTVSLRSLSLHSTVWKLELPLQMQPWRFTEGPQFHHVTTKDLQLMMSEHLKHKWKCEFAQCSFKCIFEKESRTNEHCNSFWIL